MLPPRANFWLAMLLGWLWLAAWGCAVPHAVLERPQTPPDAKVQDLLGTASLAPFPFVGAKTGWMHQYQDGSRLAAVQYADGARGVDSIKLWQKELKARQPALNTGLTIVGSSGYLTYHADGLQGMAWTSGGWVFVAEARDPNSLSHLLEASTLGGTASGQMSRTILNYVVDYSSCGMHRWSGGYFHHDEPDSPFRGCKTQGGCVPR